MVDTHFDAFYPLTQSTDTPGGHPALDDDNRQVAVLPDLSHRPVVRAASLGTAATKGSTPMGRRWLSIQGLLLLAVSSTVTVSSQAGSKELLVADRATNSILKYELSSGAFLGELVGAASGQLDEPVAMAIGPDGSLLVASRGNGRVVKYDLETGAFLGDFATGLDQPTDILVFNDEVFVSSLGPTGFDGELVYRFDAAGTQTGTIGAGTGAVGRSGLTVGADGKLYVGSFFDVRVLRFDLETGLPDGADPTGTFGIIAPEGFGTGYLAHANPSELLAVGLFSFNVVKLDATTGANLGEFIPSTAGLFFPSDILPVQESGSLLITSIGNDDPLNGFPLGSGYISRFDLGTGAVLDQFFIAGTGGLQQPTAMLVLNTLAGDLDDDGFVGQDDLSVILAAWGQNVPLGTLADINRDGFVGQDDLSVILGSWGQGSLPELNSARLATAVVPEASSLLWMASLACAGLIGWRRARSTPIAPSHE